MKNCNQSGGISFWSCFWVLFLGCGIYAGYVIAPFFYNFYELQSLMQAQADKSSIITDDEIRKTVAKKMKELSIPLENYEDLRIERFTDHIEIEYDYDETFSIDLGEYGYYEIYTFHFQPFAEKQF